MNSKVISGIGISVAVLVAGWAWYAVLSTLPSTAPAAPSPTPHVSGSMATIAAHQASMHTLLNPPDPHEAPTIAPQDPAAPPATNPTGTSPTLPGPTSDNSATPAEPQRPIPAEKWDFDLEKKPLPIEVK